jgi:ABC-2 type transport system permease protein
MNQLGKVWPIFKREFASYFATPLAYVFIVIFLLATGTFTFYVGHFFDNGIADLSVFFGYHPWLYLFLVPAIAMRLWAEERRSGTMELLLTLPVPLWATVTGKYLAAWAFVAVALALTFPIWITVNYLGDPDNGVIVAGYIGSLFMAGGYLAIGACMSAMTNNQVIAFVVSVVVCFLFTIAGSPLVLDFFRGWAPLVLVNAVASFSFLTHFQAISQGVIDLRDIIYFFSLIALFLTANVVVIDLKKVG